MKRIVIILLIIVGSILVGLWSPWLWWDIRLESILGVRQVDEIASLQVFSLGGEIEVFVDGQSEGRITVEDSPLIVDRVVPGDRKVTIRRVSTNDAAYWVFDRVIPFEPNNAVVIAYNIGPSEVFSEGHIIYASSSIMESNLSIRTNVDDASVLLNNIPVSVERGTAESRISFDRQYELSVSRNGYESALFTILPEGQEDRNLLSNKSIIVDVHLMYQPVNLE